MVVQVPGISAGNDQCTNALPYSLTSNAITLLLTFLETVIGSAVHWLFATKNIAFGASFS